jgi:hypothetical protein
MPEPCAAPALARRRGLSGPHLALTVLAVLLVLACSVQVNNGPGGVAGCASTSCPPPARSARASHTFQAQHFTFQYFDPWQVSGKDASSATVSAATNYGDLDVQFSSTTVRAGTSAAALLSNAVANLDTSQLSGLQEQGPIYGAAIGYITGAGSTYTATLEQPNAPSVPVYLEIMASVRGTVGIIFLSASTLNPNGADPTDPRQVPNADYDQMVNSLTWH